MTSTTYTIAAPPKGAMFTEYDCALCRHESLTRPVFLHSSSGGLIAAGSGCAAVALYGTRSAAAVTRVRKAFDAAAAAAADDEAGRVERQARYAAAAAEFAADRDAAPSPALQSCRSTYWSYVRHTWAGEHRMTFPAFLAAVALEGRLP